MGNNSSSIDDENSAVAITSPTNGSSAKQHDAGT
jgi:hypothetical protein